MPKIRVTNKDRVEDELMEEILQDPAKFEELLKEREQPAVKVVKKLASPVPLRQRIRRRHNEEEEEAADDGVGAGTESPPMATLVSENPLREPWIFVQGSDSTKDHYRPLTDKEWIKWRSQDPVSFDDRYELCEDGPAMYRKRTATSSRKTVPAPVEWEGDEGPAYTEHNLSHKQQQVIGGLLSLSRVHTSESGTEAELETAKLPREPAKKTLAQLNPDHFPPARKSIGTMDLSMLDEFGTDKPYKKAGRVTVPPNTKTTPAAQKKRPSVMDVRKLEATLQVAQEKAETERKAWEAEKKNAEMARRAWEEIQEAERREIMALRQTTAALRKEKETYEARYGILELRSLRDDNSVSTKSPRRHMSGSSETSQDFVEDILPIDFESVQVPQPNTRGTLQTAMPTPLEFCGPGKVMRERSTGDTAQEAANRPPFIFTEGQHAADKNALKKIHDEEEHERRERARIATTMQQLTTPVEQPGKQSQSSLASGVRGRDNQPWTPSGGTNNTIGLTKMTTLPKKSESPRITTWSLSEVKLFSEWCTTHQVSQLDNIQAWSVINQCFDQDVITTMETLVCGRRRTERLERRPLHELTLEEILRCLRESAPDTGKRFNKTLNVAGNLLQHTSAYIPTTWAEGIAMQKKVREVMDACPPEIATDIEKIRDEVKHWTSSLKAPQEWSSGETVNLKTKFCQFMRFGPNDELLSETMEIGERLLQWSKDQELPFHAYKQHNGGNRRANLREGEEHRDTASTHSPYRRAQEGYARVTQKRQRSRERRSSPRPEKRPSSRVER